MNIYPCNMDCGESNIEQGQRGGLGGGGGGEWRQEERGDN